MIETEIQATTAPRCVVDLLSQLEALSRAIAAGVTNGPNAPEVLLDNLLLCNVLLCPAMQEKPGLAGDRYDALEKAILGARDATLALQENPLGKRKWAVEQFNAAISEARRQLAVRVADAQARGDTASLKTLCCGDCVFT